MQRTNLSVARWTGSAVGEVEMGCVTPTVAVRV
jgi:hypothetical protein